jgi:Mrp family chromosome partitioning ATPase
LHRFFGGRTWPGVTDVIAGEVNVDDALKRVWGPIGKDMYDNDVDAMESDGSAPSPPSSDQSLARASKQFGTTRGTVDLLPVGSISLDPGELLAELGLGQMLATLRERADAVLIDTPPMLSVGDVMTLSAHADALLPVIRLRQTRRTDLAALTRELRNTRAATFGFIATGAASEDGLVLGPEGAYERTARRETQRATESHEGSAA